LAAAAFAPVLKALPIDVRGPDGWTTFPVALLRGSVAVTACLVPARRAANADPISLLKTD
jgi:ABC-type lipoprotein release transport system permease subunit